MVECDWSHISHRVRGDISNGIEEKAPFLNMRLHNEQFFVAGPSYSILNLCTLSKYIFYCNIISLTLTTQYPI